MNRTPKKKSCENDTLPSRRSVFEDVRPGGSFDVHRPAAITVLAVLDSLDALLVVCIILTGGRSNATVAPFSLLPWRASWSPCTDPLLRNHFGSQPLYKH